MEFIKGENEKKNVNFLKVKTELRKKFHLIKTYHLLLYTYYYK